VPRTAPQAKRTNTNPSQGPEKDLAVPTLAEMGILVATTLICGGETLALSRSTKLCSDSTYIGALEEKIRAHRLRATAHDPPFAIPALRLPQRARVLVAGAGRDRGAEEETALLMIYLLDGPIRSITHGPPPPGGSSGGHPRRLVSLGSMH
jgi:hypothetical protein